MKEGIYFWTILCVSWFTEVECLDQSQKTVLYAVLGLVGGLVTLLLVCVCVCYQVQMEAMRNLAFRELRTKCDARTKVKTIGLEHGAFNIHQATAFFNTPQQYPGNSFLMQTSDEPDTFVLPTTQPNISFMSPCNIKHQFKKKKKRTLKDLAVKHSKVAAMNLVQSEKDSIEKTGYGLHILPPLKDRTQVMNGETKHCTANEVPSLKDDDDVRTTRPKSPVISRGRSQFRLNQPIKFNVATEFGQREAGDDTTDAKPIVVEFGAEYKR